MLLLRPGLEVDAVRIVELNTDVAVVGMLEIDIEYSKARPRPHYAVIAERIDAIPSPRLGGLAGR